MLEDKVIHFKNKYTDTIFIGFLKQTLQMIEKTHTEVRNVLQPLLKNQTEKEKIL